MSWSSDIEKMAAIAKDLMRTEPTLEERAVVAPLWRWRAGMWVRLNDGPLDWSQVGLVHTLNIHGSDEADGSDIHLVAGHREWRWKTYDEGGGPRTPHPWEMPTPVLQHPAMKGFMLDMFREGGCPGAYTRKVAEGRWSLFDTEWLFPNLPKGVWDPIAGWPAYHGETEEEALVCALESNEW